jgi:hypothetical protein
MEPAELREHLRKFLGRLSRLDYLAVFAAVALKEHAPAEIAAALSTTLKELSQSADDNNGRDFDEDAVGMRPEQIAELRGDLPDFVVDLLIVALEAFVHGFLTDAAGLQPTDDSKPLETLLASLWPREARFDAQQKKAGMGKEGRAEHWSYKEVLLLSEVRNAIAHGNGTVILERSKQRLKDAGWTETELAASQVLAKRTFNDLLRFKRAVRTLANEVVSALEHSQ